MENEIRPTVLEERLGAYRLFLSMLLAHLEDNGLIDRHVIEADLWTVMKATQMGDHANSDMEDVFRVATSLCDGWKQQRPG